MPRRCAHSVVPLLLTVLASACAAPTHTSSGAVALAELKPTAGNTASGSVWVTQEKDEVVVRAQIKGLKPNSEHGFHVHEKGDCSAPDATSAGGHFNPSSQPHGAQHTAHHAGDLPSLKADAAGEAQASFRIPGSVTGSAAESLVGKGVVVHAGPDDYTSQPAGNSGPRIACGVILAPTGHNDPKYVPPQM